MAPTVQHTVLSVIADVHCEYMLFLLCMHIECVNVWVIKLNYSFASTAPRVTSSVSRTAHVPNVYNHWLDNHNTMGYSANTM